MDLFRHKIEKADSESPNTLLSPSPALTRSYRYVDDAVSGKVMLVESDWDKPINTGLDRLVIIDEVADIIVYSWKKRR
jgi:nucleoside-diphosphate-sugar epimerase